MTDPQFTIIIAAIPSTIAALAAAFVALASLIKSKENGRVADATAQKADKLIEKTTEIHTLANGNLSKMAESLAVAMKEIEGLKALLLQKEEGKQVNPEPIKAEIVNSPSNPVPTTSA